MITVKYQVTIHGLGGHGSRPDLSHSPITCFSQFEPLSSNFSSVGQFSITSVHSGNSGNVIPDLLVFEGHFTCSAEEKIPIFEAESKNISEAFGKIYHCRFDWRKI